MRGVADFHASELFTALECEFRDHMPGGFGGWSLCKAKLDKSIAAARAAAGMDDMPHWTLHDLRRSFSTHCNNNGLGKPWLI